jgi:hypothetical protein
MWIAYISNAGIASTPDTIAIERVRRYARSRSFLQTIRTDRALAPRLQCDPTQA